MTGRGSGFEPADDGVMARAANRGDEAEVDDELVRTRLDQALHLLAKGHGSRDLEVLSRRSLGGRTIGGIGLPPRAGRTALPAHHLRSAAGWAWPSPSA